MQKVRLDYARPELQPLKIRGIARNLLSAAQQIVLLVGALLLLCLLMLDWWNPLVQFWLVVVPLATGIGFYLLNKLMWRR